MKITSVFKKKSEYDNTFPSPYIIAEIGVNHEGSMETARRLIDEALEGGADAVKFQSYKAETLASKDSPAYWDTSKEPTLSQYELFKKHDSFWKKEFEELKKYCDKVGVDFISTPFDIESARFLNDLMEVFKISSSDITNKPFIEYISQFGKPVILSTGASRLSEICEAWEWIEPFNISVALLHCVLNYPTMDSSANLGMIQGLKKTFPDAIIGYSDHTLPKDMKTLETAYLLGARILEKHFTHDKSLPGNDHYHAMDKEDLKVFRKNTVRLLELIGQTSVISLPEEDLSRKNARRSLVIAKNVSKGERLTKEHLTWKRPAHGISPREIESVVGKVALQDINEDTVLQWRMLS